MFLFFSQSKARDIPVTNGHIPEPPVIILTYVYSPEVILYFIPDVFIQS
jgi:hypothetical protein